ncbi:dephospho-CoA kinase [Leptolyngbya sp. 'hensonii']|uniref:dephospho-CoA kinase n=1 Tax=Leptolyngbya sp. 'hensonii' TaxID=1922337 RepID=UPI00094FCFC7|nr:dephospho-CoA kinase [Leptolyngbya sp. 'hensonii']OLP16531.1 dephospho-CoA kinase [Leptolyngbya sp. 'hensonii']
MKRVIGLTGGIGMGKTLVSRYLEAAHHLPILDADVYARDAVAPGSPILATIVARYGAELLLADQTLDRRRLGSLVFNDPAERLWLEQQIHPYVRDRFQAALSAEVYQQGTTIVLVIPLLFEAGMTDLVTEIWVVYTSRKLQIERLLQRELGDGSDGNSLKLAEIQARIDSQMAIAEKIGAADVVLENSSTPEALYAQVDRALFRGSQGDRSAPRNGLD